MSGPPSEEGRRAPSRLLPWLVLSTLSAVAFLGWVGTADVEELTLEELPDRFVRVVLPSSEERPSGTEPARPAASSAEGEASVDAATAAAPRRAATKEDVLERSKLLSPLIGTRGQSSAVRADPWTDDERGLGVIDDHLCKACPIERYVEYREGRPRMVR